MAQVTVRTLALVLVALLLQSALGLAQSAVPPAGLSAEAAGQWKEAIQIYRAELARNPSRGDLWARIADIDARLDRIAESAAALREAAGLAPADAALQFRLSQTYSRLNEPHSALQAAGRALSLQPGNVDYLEAVGTLATWAGDYHGAQYAYRRLGALHPRDPEVALKLARVSGWAGETDESALAYRRYLSMNPDAADIWLELAKIESWRGNFANAVDVLASYRSRFGESSEYAVVRANVLASAGRPTEAIHLIEPMIQNNPGRYDLALTQTIALTMKRQIGDAFDALRSVRRLNASSPETHNAERIVRAALGSTLEPGFSFYSDSDHLQVARFSPTATLSFESGTKLLAGYERDTLSAPQQSGLGRANGQSALFESAWAGAAQTIGVLTLTGRVGSATAEDRKLTPYWIGATVRASDAFTASVERSSEFFVISPRTVELGLTERRNRFAFDWDPSLRAHVSAEGVYQELSDGNRRWEISVTPRRAIARTDWINLDLGVSAYALGTSEDLPNGYYDPRRYESYEAVVFPYLKLSENVGLSLSGGAGVQRESSASFRFGGNAGAQLTLGIYRAWLLKVGATTTHNRRLESGAFQGYAGSIVLVKRF